MDMLMPFILAGLGLAVIVYGVVYFPTKSR